MPVDGLVKGLGSETVLLPFDRPVKLYAGEEVRLLTPASYLGMPIIPGAPSDEVWLIDAQGKVLARTIGVGQ